jgi:dTDP-4-dehydrorhamnose reductase
MDWLITGGAGQLGLAISRELKFRGISFSALNSTQLDVTNVDSISSSLSEFQPRVIVNCAAWTDVDGAEKNEHLAFQINSQGAGNISLAAREIGSKLIHVSTDYVFSGDSTEPWKVADQTFPKTAYGRSKLDGERRIFEIYPQNSHVVRTAWLYSPWKKNFVKSILKQLNNNEKIRVVNNQVGQPTSALDLARQIVDLGLSRSPAATYHGTNSGQATWFEFAQEIVKLTGGDPSCVVAVDSMEFSRPANRPKYSVLNHDTWELTTLAPMREWQIALAVAMPSIISAVNEEG